MSGRAITLGILFAGLIYYYPEILAVCGPAVAAAIVMSWLFRRKVEFVADVVVLAAGSIIALALATLYLEGTLGAFSRQIRNSLDGSWWPHFQAYLYGLGEGPTKPLNFLLGIVGLYFLTPTNSLHPILQAAAAALLFCLMFLLFVTSARSFCQLLRRAPASSPSLFYVATIASCLAPLFLLLRTQYWAAGKGLSMISPLIFVLLVFPFLEAGKRRFEWRSLPAIAVIFGHLGLGLYRSIAAISPSGVHYHWPYPSVVAPKLEFDWDLEKSLPKLARCHAVDIKVEDYHLERYIQMILHDLAVASTSQLKLSSDYGRSMIRTDPSDRLSNADCVFATMLYEELNHKTIFLPFPNRDLEKYLRGEQDSVELIGRVRAIATGIYGLEGAAGSSAKYAWTTGNATFIVPNLIDRPARSLTFAEQGIRVPSVENIEISVNDRVVFSDRLPQGVLKRTIQLEGMNTWPTLTIRVKSQTGFVPPDTRALGIALNTLYLSR